MSSAFGIGIVVAASLISSIALADGETISDNAKSLAAGDGVAARTAACIAYLTVESQRPDQVAQRAEIETKIASLQTNYPKVAAGEGISDADPRGILALKMMPVETTSLTMQPPGSPATTTRPVTLDECDALAAR
jgi:hypothetical protein